MNVKNAVVVLLLSLIMALPEVQAQAPANSSMLVLAPSVLDHGTLSTSELLKRKKKRKFLKPKHNTLAVGLVGGAPLGLGARGIFRIGQFGVSADFAYNRLRDDQGDKVDAFGLRTDFRLYSKGMIARLLRPYTFIGLTSHRGQFMEGNSESVYLIDAGFGAGIKLFRLEIGAEAGLLLPARQIENYRPGIGAFVNLSAVMWLF